LAAAGERRRGGKQQNKCRAKTEPGWNMRFHNEYDSPSGTATTSCRKTTNGRCSTGESFQTGQLFDSRSDSPGSLAVTEVYCAREDRENPFLPSISDLFSPTSDFEPLFSSLLFRTSIFQTSGTRGLQRRPLRCERPGLALRRLGAGVGGGRVVLKELVHLL
jgi:hypothetical protein